MTVRADFDTPWKLILDRYFQSFLELCHPEAAQGIDWSKGYELLDKELSSIMKGAEIGTRVVDKLIKVWCLNGEETWVLIHIDVQAQRKSQFAKRMFVYYYRLFNRYQKPIVSLPVLADSHRNWRPSIYEKSLWGCELKFKFVSIKLLDYENKHALLLQSNNPFALAILAQLAALKTQSDEQGRLLAKLNLSRSLYRKGWDKVAIMDFYSFIDWVIALPPVLEIEYLEQMSHLEEEKKMAYMITAERVGMQRGLKQGIQQALLGGKATLLRLVQRKFGEMPACYRIRVENAEDNKELLKWIENIFLANSIEEIFETE